MDYKHLLDTTNFLVASLMEAKEDMGLNVDLMLAQRARTFEGDIKGLLLESDMDLTKIEDTKHIPDFMQHCDEAVKSFEKE